MPVEVMAKRGRDTLRFGPLKPVGLRDPRSDREAYAVVQLRQEDRAGRMWNVVGFQTRLRIPEQQRVLRLIPGLGSAEFLRYGSIHRNSYLNSPAALSAHLATRDDPTILFAGQITGVEGYTESSATGLLAGINLARILSGEPPVIPPTTTMLGALYRSAVNERGIGRVELPPTPRLQVDPPGELAALRQSENAALSSYAWVDRSRGFVRIPIDRALALTTERGLPGWRRP